MSGRLIEMNASPWLWIETTWVIIFSALALALRIIVRSHEYGFEDTLLVLAFIFAMASFGCIYQALYDGLGISPQSLLEARTLRIAKVSGNDGRKGHDLGWLAGPLEAVDSSNVIQDHLRRYYARQDAYHSFSQCGRPHHRLDNMSCRHLGFSMFRSKTGLEAILVISILIESFIFLFIIMFVWSIESEGSKQAYSSHYLWHEITSCPDLDLLPRGLQTLYH
ncbi:hypothetical protein D6C81_08174 [Aureobasidium pullulans]|nr:hypothetical protein D6C81_08174 [Aureobasidium pullulans]